MGFKEKLKKSAREVSKSISSDIAQERHLGKYTYESLSQELIALSQTKIMFRDSKWKKRLIVIEHEIKLKISQGGSNFSKYQTMLICLIQVGAMR
jgi:hypothetical protein